MNLATARLLLSKPMGFITAAEVGALVEAHRLCPLVVRFECFRFICGAQDLNLLLEPLIAAGNHLRDVSIHPEELAAARAVVRRESFHERFRDFDESDCGGVFDGFGVISDADPGL